jgi:hypothetical protein
MTHTPGPWTAEDCDGLYVRPADTSANIICDVINRGGKDSRQTDEDWANAMLLAAAPDLLAALPTVPHPGGRLVKVVAHYEDGSTQTIDGFVIEAAVARATGGE